MGLDEIARQAIAEHGAAQKESELSWLLSLLLPNRPRAVFEIGSYRGGTLWAFSQVAAADARLVSVDILGGPFGGGAPVETVRGNVGPRAAQVLDIFPCDSHDPHTMREVAGVCDFLFIDGDHTYEGVRRDYEVWSPAVRRDGLIAFHDVIDYGSPDQHGEVHRFWREIKDETAREYADADGRPWGGIGVLVAAL